MALISKWALMFVFVYHYNQCYLLYFCTKVSISLDSPTINCLVISVAVVNSSMNYVVLKLKCITSLLSNETFNLRNQRNHRSNFHWLVRHLEKCLYVALKNISWQEILFVRLFFNCLQNLFLKSDFFLIINCYLAYKCLV